MAVIADVSRKGNGIPMPNAIKIDTYAKQWAAKLNFYEMISM